MPALNLTTLRRYAVARTLFPPTSLRRALARLGFVQADPIRAPARAQDLVLRHRVRNYRAGDLERTYAKHDLEEDFFVNYGFVSKRVHALMHPRVPRTRWSRSVQLRADAVLAHVRSRGEVHPRDVDLHFAHGSVTNAWGGSSNATTHLLDGMHYRGLLRVARRDGGIRVYAVREPTAAPATPAEHAAVLDQLVDVIVNIYAPLPARGLSILVRRLRIGAPQLARGIDAALTRATRRLASAAIDRTTWYWPADELPGALATTVDDEVRLLAPFDPIVWDRARFEQLWGWPYRFEAYTPLARRAYGYYALPLLYRDKVIGWGNVGVIDGVLSAQFGYSAKPPATAAYRRALDDELARLRLFLRVQPRITAALTTDR